MERKLAPLLSAGPGSQSLEPSVDIDRPLAASHGALLPRRFWKGLAASTERTAKVAVTSAALMVGAFWLGRTTANPTEPASGIAEQAVSAPPAQTLPVPARTERPPASSALSGPAESVPPAEPVPVEPAPVVARPESARATPPEAPRAEKAPKASDDIDALGKIEVALRRGDAKGALAKLDELGKPSQLRLRRLANVLRAVALCELGHLDEGRRLLEQIGAHRELSLFTERVGRACQLGHEQPRVLVKPLHEGVGRASTQRAPFETSGRSSTDAPALQ